MTLAELAEIEARAKLLEPFRFEVVNDAVASGELLAFNDLKSDVPALIAECRRLIDALDGVVSYITSPAYEGCFTLNWVHGQRFEGEPWESGRAKIAVAKAILADYAAEDRAIVEAIHAEKEIAIE